MGLDSWWRTHTTYEALRGEHWLLSYESVVQGWLPRTGPGPATSEDTAARDFSELLNSAGVRFLIDRFAVVSQSY